jgi:hypothetical protein
MPDQRVETATARPVSGVVTSGQVGLVGTPSVAHSKFRTRRHRRKFRSALVTQGGHRRPRAQGGERVGRDVAQPVGVIPEEQIAMRDVTVGLDDEIFPETTTAELAGTRGVIA